MRVCKYCGINKEIEKFVKDKNRFRHKCKDCRNKERRTGKLRGGFCKGHIPWNLGNDTSRNTKKYHEWRNKVLERDKYKCVKCNSTKFLHCDHIVPWKENESIRYELSNGQTLCAKCHLKKGKKNGEVDDSLSKFKKGHEPWNKGSRVDLPQQKTCKTCNCLKNINEYSKCKDWYLNECKKCRRERYKT